MTDDEATPPQVFIQYKGTDICLDLRCPCGVLGHFDGYFAYAIECGACGRKFTLPTTLELLPWNEDAHEPVLARVDD